MAHKALILAFSMMIAAAPVSAAQDEPAAPSAGPDAKYCLRVDVTGSNVEITRCWTREKWAEQGVDVDKEWAKEGVRVIEG